MYLGLSPVKTNIFHSFMIFMLSLLCAINQIDYGRLRHIYEGIVTYPSGNSGLVRTHPPQTTFNKNFILE